MKRNALLLASVLLFTFAGCAEEHIPGLLSGVTDLEAVASGTGVALQWSAPADLQGDRAYAYEIRYAAFPITPTNWDSATPVSAPPTPHSPGTVERFVIPSLDDFTLYSFGVCSLNEAGERSPISNVVNFQTTNDRSSPEDVAAFLEWAYDDPDRDASHLANLLHPDFRFFFSDASRSGAGLPESWDRETLLAAMGSLYDQALSMHADVGFMETVAGARTAGVKGEEPLVVEMTVDLRVVVPSSPLDLLMQALGTAEVTLVPDEEDPSRWVIRSIRDRTDVSPLAEAGSAVNSSWGRILAYFQVADLEPPGAVSDLAATMDGRTVVLTWTAPGDDGAVGIANAYEIRYSSHPIAQWSWEYAALLPDAPIPKRAGMLESMNAPSPPLYTSRYFAVRALDEAGNLAPISNVVAVFPEGEAETAEDAITLFGWQHGDPRRDIAAVAELLHPDFLFWFTDEDRVSNPDIPEFWGKSPFVNATGNMFSTAVSIRMVLTPGPMLAEEPCDPSNPDVICQVWEVDVDLEIGRAHV